MNGPDADVYMAEDQSKINEYVRDLLSSSGKLDSKLLDKIYLRLRRHIFIEETILFPTLPESTRDDVEYLEKEHGKILASSRQMKDSLDDKDKIDRLSDLYSLLLEHNSYEESFVYDYFQDKDAEIIRNTYLPPRKWESLYERTYI